MCHTFLVNGLRTLVLDWMTNGTAEEQQRFGGMSTKELFVGFMAKGEHGDNLLPACSPFI